MERCNGNNDIRPNNARKIVLGLIIIALGAFLLADNLSGLSGYLRSIIFSWPMLLVAIGFLNLFGRRSYMTGLILIIAGGFFLIPKIFYNIDIDFTRLFWPVILIAIGLMIIVRRGMGYEHRHFHRHFHHHFHTQTLNDNSNSNNSDDGYIDEVNIFGGGKKNIMSQNFKGGRITCIFGGSELDFTHAQLAEGTNVIDIVCMFGGTSLIVPADWKVRSDVVSILGGFSDKRVSITSSSSQNRELIIKGVAIFGGGDVKSI